MPSVRIGRQGILCPKCRSHTRVLRTEPYGVVIIRVRMCKNDRCRHTFDTKEGIVHDTDRNDPGLFDE